MWPIRRAYSTKGGCSNDQPVVLPGGHKLILCQLTQSSLSHCQAACLAFPDAQRNIWNPRPTCSAFPLASWPATQSLAPWLTMSTFFWWSLGTGVWVQEKEIGLLFWLKVVCLTDTQHLSLTPRDLRRSRKEAASFRIIRHQERLMQTTRSYAYGSFVLVCVCVPTRLLYSRCLSSYVCSENDSRDSNECQRMRVFQVKVWGLVCFTSL